MELPESVNHKRIGHRRGAYVEKVPDPTRNPLDRLKVTVLPEKAGMMAAELADALAREPVPIIIRGHEAELGWFYIDVCNMRPGDERIVAEAIQRRLA